MLNEEFYSEVARLSVPEMGTESAAPLLYWLVRFIRPRTVLEVGMGYTTPFLAKALQDNEAAVREESLSIGRNARSEATPLIRDEYYATAYEPKLVCIDRMTDAASSASQTHRVLQELGLDQACVVIEGDLQGASRSVVDQMGVIDFAWIDTWDTLAFIGEFWDLINPAGGVLAVHWLMTYPQGRAVLRWIESLRVPEGGRLEVSNFVEPHKFAQNSLTLVRRVRDYVDPEDLRPDGDARDRTGVLS